MMTISLMNDYIKFKNKNQLHKTNKYSKLYPKFNFIVNDELFKVKYINELEREYYYGSKKHKWITEYIPLYPESFYQYWEIIQHISYFSFINNFETYGIMISKLYNEDNGCIEAFMKYNCESMLNNHCEKYMEDKKYDIIIIDKYTDLNNILKIGGKCIIQLDYNDKLFRKIIKNIKREYDIESAYIPKCQHYLKSHIYLILINYLNKNKTSFPDIFNLVSKHKLKEINIFRPSYKKTKYEYIKKWCDKFNIKMIEKPKKSIINNKYYSENYFTNSSSNNSLKKYICYQNIIASREKFSKIVDFIDPYRYLEIFVSNKYNINVNRNFCELYEILINEKITKIKNIFVINDNGFINCAKSYYQNIISYTSNIGQEYKSNEYYKSKKMPITKKITKEYIKDLCKIVPIFDLIIVDTTNCNDPEKFIILIINILRLYKLENKVTIIFKIIYPINIIVEKLLNILKKIFKIIKIVLPSCLCTAKSNSYIIFNNLIKIPQKNYYKVLLNEPNHKSYSNMDIINKYLEDNISTICYYYEYERNIKLQKYIYAIQKYNRHNWIKN